ncbi:unnamed protein product [Dovyalis caffra]|uniref:RWP-RK domain-containing protein n=1 Tax=Dovyalis caffra TaxID=77055 RepID=A0AAV1S606_9ROSI|nr:unnamed protein product [Dovyalis caffra]
MNIQQQNQSKSLSLEDISNHFSLPLSDAASNLGVCVSVLKKICRENGLDRWPYRKYLAGKSIEDIKRHAARERTKALADLAKAASNKNVIQQQNNENSKSQGMALPHKLQQQGTKDVLAGRQQIMLAPGLAKGLMGLDEFKYGFPSDGLSTAANKWWGSGLSDTHRGTDKTETETDEDDNHQSEEKAHGGTDVMTVDKEKAGNGLAENEIDPKGTVLLTSVRKRAVEEGRGALKLGVYRTYGVNKTLSPADGTLLHLVASSCNNLLINARDVLDSKPNIEARPPGAHKQHRFLQSTGIVCIVESLALSPSLAKPNCQAFCGEVSIPFPFGIGPDCYSHKLLEIVCNETFSPPKPFASSINLEVLNISIGNSRIHVNLPIASSGCNGAATSSVSINLESSPFALSERNIFTAIGCENLALLREKSTVIGGCMPLCDQNKNMIKGGCFGINCCQTTIPLDLREYNASIGSMKNSERSVGCKYAFLVDQLWFGANLADLQAVNKMNFVPVVLDWWIDRWTFDWPSLDEQSRMQHQNFSCLIYKAASSPSNNGSKIQCHCKRGFEGNPYLNEGCQDIDECDVPNACRKPMICKNFMGSWGCHHPPEFGNSQVDMVFTGMTLSLKSYE